MSSKNLSGWQMAMLAFPELLSPMSDNSSNKNETNPKKGRAAPTELTKDARRTKLGDTKTLSKKRDDTKKKSASPTKPTEEVKISKLADTKKRPDAMKDAKKKPVSPTKQTKSVKIPKSDNKGAVSDDKKAMRKKPVSRTKPAASVELPESDGTKTTSGEKRATRTKSVSSVAKPTNNIKVPKLDDIKTVSDDKKATRKRSITTADSTKVVKKRRVGSSPTKATSDKRRSVDVKKEGKTATLKKRTNINVRKEKLSTITGNESDGGTKDKENNGITSRRRTRSMSRQLEAQGAEASDDPEKGMLERLPPRAKKTKHVKRRQSMDLHEMLGITKNPKKEVATPKRKMSSDEETSEDYEKSRNTRPLPGVVTNPSVPAYKYYNRRGQEKDSYANKLRSMTAMLARKPGGGRRR
ncbi:protein unc-isoform a [Diplodia corticola]|uniref:Protein unc-isoform a n=1 Tax=Diplodia corticola TaxID=236234 RepID=A0A1J9QYH6_9PEZI|nr:protein unc-isoform a [Diplodia corticola]OJD34102.1 protein unc-isoform a [Diplodia corticola]